MSYLPSWLSLYFYDLRSPTKEEETITNPTDRIVAYLLFHRHCSQVAAATKEEIISSIPLTLEPGELPICI
jgi:hypothetical protein